MAFPAIQTSAYSELESNSTVISATVPASTAENDLLIAFHVTDGSETHTAEAGWNQVGTETDEGTVTLSVWERLAPASPPSTYDFTSGSTEHHIVTMFRITGHNTSTPVEGSTANTGASTDPINSAHTAGSSQDYLTFYAFGSDRNRIGTEDTGYPSGLTGHFVREAGTDGSACGHGIASKNITGTNLPSETWTGILDTSDGWATRTVAVQPTSGVETPQAVAGNMPNPTGGVTTAITTAQALAGAMPFATGDITSKKTLKQLAGSMPNSTGDVFKKTSTSLDGAMPNPTGSVLKKAFLSFAGNMPFASGIVATSFVVKQALAGDMPNATGLLATTVKILQALSGIMGAITGDVATLFIAGVGGARRVVAVIGASFKKFLQ